MTVEDKNIEKEEIVDEQPDSIKKSEPISIAARNLRLLKRIVLGKKKPPRFLRILCWFNIGWSTLMMLYFGLVGILIKTAFIHDSDFVVIGSKYFFVYAAMHAIAIFGVILIWRLKKTGFYIFSVATIIMPFLFLLMTWNLNETLGSKTGRIEPVILLYSVVMIALFAINWKSLNLIKNQS